ncbi:ABC transporter substrate-binding protein [Streptomyces sp. NPDC006274]|uniref:ABC transporter substrate-binding protein n=1 Tax=unclassified Streptomyces TaxID=2593676 RepID=UPI00339ED984
MGRYRILARLGAGGMGRVYLGRSTSGRMVAVKVVRDELAGDPEFQRRFAREVEAARRVTGFFTAAVVDADPTGSPAWLATAYVPGLPLDEAVHSHGAWPRRSLLVLGAGLVEALEAIHGVGLIHRDLKPSNVLLAGDGPRVIDFGISIVTEASSLTQTGMVVGTPGFMSPEQVTGQPVGPAGDVFSLGAVLAFAATGTGPFGNGAPHSVNFRAVYQEPVLNGLPPGTEFIGRCLQKDPALRPTVPQLLAEFARLLGDANGHTLTGRVPRESEWLPEAVATALARQTSGAAADAPSNITPVPPSDPRIDLAKRPAAPPAPPLPPTAPPYAPDAAAPGYGPPQQHPAPHVHQQPFVTGPPAGYSTAPAGRPVHGPARGRRIAAIGVAVALVAGGGITALVLNQESDKGRKVSTDRGTDKGTGEGTGGQSPPPAAAGFNAAVGHVVNPSDKKGGTLRLVSSSDADSWDPGRSYYGWVWNMQRLYARTLLTYSPRPGKEGLDLVPDLAAAQPRVSADGRTYTVKLRPGLTFADGSPITAADVKYGIERVFAQDVISGGPTYLIEALDQKQNYPGPYEDSASPGLRSIDTPDSRTLVFRLAKADSQFPYLLAMGATAPVPQQKDTGAEYGAEPVSSGPYRFESYQPGRKLVLVRNEHWDRETDPIRRALPDRIELTVLGDPAEVDARLLDGRAHLDVSQAGLSETGTARVLRSPDLKAAADNPYRGYIRFAVVASKTAPFDDVHCRKAVMYAADTNDLRTARGGPTAGSLHGNMLPPTLLGADDHDPFGLTDGKPDLDRAKKELKACGKPGGFTTKIAVRSDNAKDVQAAAALQNSLKAAGITLETDRYEDFAAFYEHIGSPASIRKKGTGLFLLGWGADYPTGSGFLQPLADSRLITPRGSTNYAQVDDPRIDEMFDKASAATDSAAAERIHRSINHRLTDGAYYLPFVADKAVNYRSPRLTNVYVHEAYNVIDIATLGTGTGS